MIPNRIRNIGNDYSVYMRKLKQALLIGTLGVFLGGCSEFALLMSGSSIAISQNAYVKAYNSVDVLTLINTDKSIKGHTYDNIKGLMNKH
jgi:hypothetical protein|tara:strand:+ start:2766 stop:3035 length:270 start_codon:yes stop_codon:yes gene_type:complete